jgi:hypothetical protein
MQGKENGDADGLMVSAVWLQDAQSVAVAEGCNCANKGGWA